MSAPEDRAPVDDHASGHADPTRPLADDLVADDLVADELLVEEISIDGMCGVY